MFKKKIFYGSFCLAVLILFINTYLFAQPPVQVATGTPSVYKVTMKRFAISQDGSTWFTVANTETQVDIASVSAVSKVGDWMASTDIPVGTYTRVRPTASATFVMQGYVYYSTTVRTYFTTPSGISSVSGNVTDTSQMPNYGEQSITISETGCPGGECTNTENQTFTISQTMSVRKRIRFDVTGKLGLYTESGSYVFYPEPPTVDTIDVP